MKDLIKRIKEYISQTKKDLKEYYENQSMVGKTLFVGFSIILFELTFLMVFSIAQSFMTVFLHKDFTTKHVDYLKYLDNNGSHIENTLIISDLQHETVSFSPVFNKLYQREEIEKLRDNKIVFNIVSYASFVRHIEPIFLKKNIKYEWANKKDSGLPLFTSFVVEHFTTVLFILFFLWMMEKQGVFGSKEKYKKIDQTKIVGNMDDLVGLEDIKSEVIQLAEMLKDRVKFAEYGITDTFNILMSGPPGTGKTRMAQYLAKTLDIPMIAGTGNVETGFVNGGANTIKDLFATARDTARMHPSRTCLVFLDEAQNLFRKRGGGNNRWEDDSSNELLAQLDGIHTKNDVDIIFVAASNFNENNMGMDEAMLRRFKKKIFFRLPNKSERESIFKLFLSKIKTEHVATDIDFDYISQITNTLSPATIESVVQEAGFLAIVEKKQVDTFILEKAFERIFVGKSNKDPDKKQIEKVIALHEIGHFIQEFEIVRTKLFPSLSDSDIEATDLLAIKKDMTTLKISIESIAQVGALGYVLHREDGIGLKTKQSLENDIIKLYGGLAAEQVFLNHDLANNNITVGSANDIEKVSHIFNMMINKLGMYSKSKINLGIIENIQNKVDIIGILEKESERLFEISLSVIIKERELIEFLANELETRYVLSLNEVFVLITNFFETKYPRPID